jgi:excisionase family DNA binding protein
MESKSGAVPPIIKYASVTVSPKKRDLVKQAAERDMRSDEVLEAVKAMTILQAQESFSYEEVATLLSVSKRQVQEWVSAGELKILDLPGTERLRRVSRDQLKASVYQAEIRSGFKRPRGMTLS